MNFNDSSSPKYPGTSPPYPGTSPPYPLGVSHAYADGSSSTSKYHFAEALLLAFPLCVIIFFSVFGNILVCVAVMTDRNLRKTSNFFIVSLAVADALVGILVMTFAVANDLYGYWVFGPVLCKIWISSDIMCSTASILNLCSISLDRYVHIRNPLHYDNWMTTKRTLACVAGVWILSLTMSFLPIHMGWHETSGGVGGGGVGGWAAKSPSGLRGQHMANSSLTTSAFHPTSIAATSTSQFMCVLELNPLYAVLSSSVSFYAPCVVMILIYLRLYRYARKHAKCIRQQQRLSSLNTSGCQSNDEGASNDHKAAITLGVIMGVFLACWAPFFTINVVASLWPGSIPAPAFSFFSWLGYFNSTLNPVIYSIFNGEFRAAFKRVLRGWCRPCGRTNDPLDSLSCRPKGAPMYVANNAHAQKSKQPEVTNSHECASLMNTRTTRKISLSLPGEDKDHDEVDTKIALSSTRNADFV